MKSKARKTVVLVHGLRGSHHGLKSISEGLLGDFEVVTPDLPGTGETPELEHQNLEGHVEWLREYVAGLSCKPVMAGHSMGSIIVSHFVSKYPEMVDESVILMSPIVRSRTAEVAGKTLSGAVRGVLSPLPAEGRRKVLASKPASWAIAMYLTADRSKQKEILEAHYKYGSGFASAKSLYGDMGLSAANETVIPAGKRVLLIFGRKDRLSSGSRVKRRAMDAGAEYLELDAAGHLINYERPREVAERIKLFLA